MKIHPLQQGFFANIHAKYDFLKMFEKSCEISQKGAFYYILHDFTGFLSKALVFMHIYALYKH